MLDLILTILFVMIYYKLDISFSENEVDNPIYKKDRNSFLFHKIKK